MELTGKVIAILPAQSGVSQKNGQSWMNQQYVIEVPGQFPKKCVFKVSGENRIRQFNIQMGEDITIHIDIDAHEYNGRWYNEITAYNMTRPQVVQAAYTRTAPQPAPQPAPQQQYQQQVPNGMPFPQQQAQQTAPTQGGLPF